MYRNLKAEMARKDILSKDLALLLGITEKSMTNKMRGATEFTRKEMWLIKNQEFPECSIDYLFDSNVSPEKAG